MIRPLVINSPMSKSSLNEPSKGIGTHSLEVQVAPTALFVCPELKFRRSVIGVRFLLAGSVQRIGMGNAQPRELIDNRHSVFDGGRLAVNRLDASDKLRISHV